MSNLELCRAEHDTIMYWMYWKCPLQTRNTDYLGCAQAGRGKWY